MIQSSQCCQKIVLECGLSLSNHLKNFPSKTSPTRKFSYQEKWKCLVQTTLPISISYSKYTKADRISLLFLLFLLALLIYLHIPEYIVFNSGIIICVCKLWQSHKLRFRPHEKHEQNKLYEFKRYKCSKNVKISHSEWPLLQWFCLLQYLLVNSL